LFSKYEYWPTLAFYWPISLWGPLQALRAGHPCFFTSLNPGWEGGGIGFESKYGILRDLPAALRPATLRTVPARDGSGEVATMTSRYPAEVRSGTVTPATLPADNPATVLAALADNGISFPLIAKPDVGFRGRLVRRIENAEQLTSYLSANPIPLLLQELIELPVELGVLYYRMPGQARGCITSVTRKRFLSVTGTGQSSLRELVQADDRAKRQLPRLEREYHTVLDQVVPAGEVVALGTIGNHSKGTAFLDGRELITPALVAIFDRIADQLPNFTYGRFDLRCASPEGLLKGECKILEINGALAEPTHFYDPSRNNYFSAVRDIMAHWYRIGTISRIQIKRGVRPVPLRPMLRKLFALKRYVRYLRHLDENA